MYREHSDSRLTLHAKACAAGSTRFAIPAAHNSYWLLAAGYWLLVTGCWLLVTWFLAAGYRGLEAGIKTIGCWLLAVLGHWL